MEEVLDAAFVSDYLSCPVCHDMFNAADRIPLVFKCGHSVCEGCTRSLMDGGRARSMMCPVCRKMHDVRYAGRMPFPKNYTMAAIIEKVSELRSRQNEQEFTERRNTCRECQQDVQEHQLTQCECVQGVHCGQVDFMNRPKNLLICLDCIEERHHEHDYKPFPAVTAAWDCMKECTDMKIQAKKLREKTAGIEMSLKNVLLVLSNLNQKIEKTSNRLAARPTSAAHLRTLEDFNTKLHSIEKDMTGMSRAVFANTGIMEKNSQFVKEYSTKGGLPYDPNRLPLLRRADGAAENADGLAIGDGAVVRIGNDGNIQLQMNVALNDAEDPVAAENQIVQAIQHNLVGALPVLRQHLERGGNDIQNIQRIDADAEEEDGGGEEDDEDDDEVRDVEGQARFIIEDPEPILDQLHDLHRQVRQARLRALEQLHAQEVPDNAEFEVRHEMIINFDPNHHGAQAEVERLRRVVQRAFERRGNVEERMVLVPPPGQPAAMPPVQAPQPRRRGRPPGQANNARRIARVRPEPMNHRYQLRNRRDGRARR
ncbi:unnamed protein product [Caenorhabditis sp. 36 PRJEB53466]|nr:unnamed protein product [Caenorhabditis sp. 36 PRJEB53466]